MPCFVERTGFTGGFTAPQTVPGATAAAAGAGTLFSRSRGPTRDPEVTGRRRDAQGRIEAPLDGPLNHVTQYDPDSSYRVSWDVGVTGDSAVHYTDESVSRRHPDRHKPPPGFDGA